MLKSTFKSLSLLAFIAILSSSSLSAQKIYFWLDAGLKIQGGTGMLYNANLINDRTIDPKFASTYGFGGKFGFNFGQYHAITVDGIYSLASQNNTIIEEINGMNVLTPKKLSFNAIDLYLLYRYNRNLNYIELGAKYSMYQKFNEAVGTGNTVLVDEFYQDNMISPVLGFGYYMYNADAFTANLGFRLSYGISDLLTDSGEQISHFTFPKEYSAYKSTNPAFIELVLELNFGLGQYAKSVCGKRASFMGL